MSLLHNRYFIELQAPTDAAVSRGRETEIHRELAFAFLATIHDWLQENEMSGKVSALDVTAFGQIHIACEASVINLIRNQDVVNIAAIRPGIYTDNLARLAEAR